MFVRHLASAALALTIAMQTAQAWEDKGEVCWISNSGFFLDTPGGDVLVDAILSSDDEIARAEGRFADVRLIFISHVHGDHFNSAGTLRHLRVNPKARLIVTPEIEGVLKRGDWSNELASRTIVSLPEWERLEAFQTPDFSGHVMQFKHSGVQNLGLAVSGQGVRLLYANGGWHSQARLEQLASLYPQTDLVIANKWPLPNNEYVSGIEQRFSPSWLLMAHHSGRRDGIVESNGGAQAMESAMSRQDMRGRIFGSRMECVALPD